MKPACLPRVVPTGGGVRRHHVELRLTEASLQAEERWLVED